jgi:hypothetical protein
MRRDEVELQESFVSNLKIKAFVFLSLFTLTTLNPMLKAQTATGQVNGTVTDAQGGTVPDATVRLSNQATGIETTRPTNSSGAFVFVNVQPGAYVIRVSKPGFKEAEISAVSVGVNQAATVNVTLDVGAVAETVAVTAESPLIQPTTTELGTVIPQKVVNDLPLNGRNFTQLLTLTPGVTPVSTAQNRSIGCCEGNVGLPGSGFADASFHGQENRSKLYFFDGIINTNIRGPTYIVIPNIDLIQEFVVTGHDSKAEFGGAAGGVVNMVSKPGGNAIHGSAFEYVRNNFFDARDTFKDAKKTGPAAFRQNQFGGVITGPIIKNKTFFSGGYDGWRFSQPSQALAYVPTAAEIAGDFTNTTVVSGHNLYNPYSTRAVGNGFVRDRFRCDASGNPLPVNAQGLQNQGVGAPCNKLPQGLISAPMQQFFGQYAAAPNYAAAGDLTHNFIQGRGTTNNANSFQIRVDHRFSDNDSVFFRYTEQRVSTFTPIGELGSTAGGSQGRNYGGAWTHTFGANIILDVRAGYAGRPGVDAGQQNQHPAGLDGLKKAGFTDIDRYQGMLVNLTTNEWTNGGNNSFGVRGAAPRENPNWSFTPNVTFVKGNHNLRAGFWFIDAKRIQQNTFQTYTFADDQTGDPTRASGTTGLSLASALLGFPTNFQGQLPTVQGGEVAFKYAAWAAYVQDEWRLRPGLTLTMGLRYDYLTQPQTTDGRLWNALDIPNKRWIIGAKTMPPLCSAAQAAPCIPDAFQNDPHFNNVVLAGKSFFAPPPVKDNWGPRVGLAWQITPKTVLRTGYGLYWDAVPSRSQYAQNDLELAVWPGATAFSGNVNATSAFANGSQALLTSIQGHFPTPLPPTNPWSPTNTFGDDPRYKDGYSHQWQFEIQREFTPNLMLSTAYVGSSNGRLPYTGLANAASQASPNGTPAAQIDALRAMPWVNANITYSQSIGYSHYNALETKLQRRFANGLSSLVSYTFGKSTDISSGYFNVENGPGGGSTVQNYYDQSSARGVSGYDITHFLSWATVYELPFGRGKRMLSHGPLSWFLGNWQLNYILQARSGQPYNLTVAGDVANLKGSAANIGNYARPNLVGDPFRAGAVAANPDPTCRATISQGGRAPDVIGNSASLFNPCAFAVPSGSFGNLGRNTFRGPGVFNMDTSMFKSIPLPKEGWELQLRFESFNTFNVQNWDVPSGVTIGAANAGQVTALASGTTPRQLQFGMRVQF